MLTYRSSGILVIILTVLILLLMIFRLQAGWLLLPLAVGYLAMLVIASARICSNFYIPAICKGISHEKVVSLTFDDGPDERITPVVLEILDKYKVKASFFLIGKKAEAHPELVKLIVSSGHTVGLHSYSHAFWFDLYSKKMMERDLQQAENILRKITGEKPVLFRPPFGVTNPQLAQAVKKLGYHVIGWSVRSYDTNFKNADRVVERVIKGLHPGAVVLMHDTQEIAPTAAEKVILEAREKGYRFVLLEKLWSSEVYAEE